MVGGDNSEVIWEVSPTFTLGFIFTGTDSFWMSNTTRAVPKVTTPIMCTACMWNKRCEINVSYSGGSWDSTVKVSLHSDQYNTNSDVSKMENISDTLYKRNVRAIICFLYLEGVLGNDIHHWLCNVISHRQINNCSRESNTSLGGRRFATGVTACYDHRDYRLFGGK